MYPCKISKGSMELMGMYCRYDPTIVLDWFNKDSSQLVGVINERVA